MSACYVLTINNFSGLVAITNFINGKMRGPKYNQLLLLIEYLNKKSNTINIKPLGLCLTPIGEDS